MVKADRKKEKKRPPPTIDIFKAWCKGCGICVAFCPKKALALDETGSPYVKDAALCGRCGLCELRCPDFAITIEDGKEEGSEERREKAEP
jgi:2-oxoglutarate ferredoxin oxidoreductase subunit delta